MLNRLTDTNIQNSLVGQTNGADKTGLFSKLNPYEKSKDNLLIDQLDISSDAMTLYEKYRDIKQFTNLVLSDPEDSSHNSIVASQIQEGVIDISDEEIVDSLFNNPNFFEDLIG